MPHRPPLDATRVALAAPWTGLEVVEEIDSTNVAALGRPPGSVLAAEFQTAGRGRLDRSWVSPARAGLSFSVVLRPSPPLSTWGWLPLLAGLAVCDVIESAVLKWPNDVLLGSPHRKLAGILAQASVPDVIVGIGLNVSTTPAELPVDTATSLAIEGREVDRSGLLAGLLDAFGRRVLDWSGDGGRGPVDEYVRRCATIGQLVRVHAVDSSLAEGEAVGVDETGRLIVVTPDGPMAVAAGDVEHVRPVTQ